MDVCHVYDRCQYFHLLAVSGERTVFQGAYAGGRRVGRVCRSLLLHSETGVLLSDWLHGVYADF